MTIIEAQTLLSLIACQSPKVYRALLNQTGNNAPIATVLENSAGITSGWVYMTTGEYALDLDALAPAPDRVGCLINQSQLSAGIWIISCAYQNVGPGDRFVYVQTAGADNRLSNTFIQILIYP